MSTLNLYRVPASLYQLYHLLHKSKFNMTVYSLHTRHDGCQLHCIYLLNESEEVVQLGSGELAGGGREDAVDVLHLDRVLVYLHLPDGGELLQGELRAKELDNRPQLVAVLSLVEVP